MPADVVLDGELVCWDPDRGRVDFQGLSRRLTAGRRLSSLAAARPAYKTFVMRQLLPRAQ